MRSEIVNMMYTIGPILIEDEDFLRVTESARKRVEEKRRESTSGEKAPKKEENYKDKKKTR
jgi:hypothetical protein